MRNVSDKSYRENQNIFCVQYPPPLSKIMPFMRYVEKYGRAMQITNDNITRLMPFACWIIKAKDTHSM